MHLTFVGVRLHLEARWCLQVTSRGPTIPLRPLPVELLNTLRDAAVQWSYTTAVLSLVTRVYGSFKLHPRFL